jgi:TraX protein
MSSAAVPGKPQMFSLEMSAASIDALKWLAVALMVVDHINKFVFKESVPSMFALCRVAMPLFVFVLGYNLARPGALQAGAYPRVFIRLLVFGVLSVVPHALMNTLVWGWWPVNILFTLAVAVLVAWLLDQGGPVPVIVACLVFVFGGALVEFWWPAIAACVFVWAYFKNPSLVYAGGFVASLLALYVINGNFWALLALPAIGAARGWRWPLPRMKWFFYGFYPLHFLLIWAYLRVLG